MGFASGGSCSNALTALGLHRDLALSTTNHLRWAVDQALAGGCTFSSVDLVNLPSIDCAALGVLNRTQGARGRHRPALAVRRQPTYRRTTRTRPEGCHRHPERATWRRAAARRVLTS